MKFCQVATLLAAAAPVAVLAGRFHIPDAIPAMFKLEKRTNAANLTLYQNPLNDTDNQSFTPQEADVTVVPGDYGATATPCQAFSSVPSNWNPDNLITAATSNEGYICVLYRSEDCDPSQAVTLSQLPSGTQMGIEALPTDFDNQIVAYACVEGSVSSAGGATSAATSGAPATTGTATGTAGTTAATSAATATAA